MTIDCKVVRAVGDKAGCIPQLWVADPYVALRDTFGVVRRKLRDYERERRRFHRNSVLGRPVEELCIATAARFVEERGELGPPGSTCPCMNRSHVGRATSPVHRHCYGLRRGVGFVRTRFTTGGSLRLEPISGPLLDLLLFKDGRRLGIDIKRADAPALTPSVRSALADLTRAAHRFISRLTVVRIGATSTCAADW